MISAFLLPAAFAIGAQPLPLCAQNPNDPGLMDPVVHELIARPFRLPGSHQVTGHSEQINIVGKVRRKKADKGKSATGKPISANGTNSPNRDIRDGLREMEDAASIGDTGTMLAIAAQLQQVLLGTTEGKIYDGFALLQSNRGGWLPDHVPGEHKAKRMQNRGRTTPGLDGVVRPVWEVDVNLLYFDEEMASDTTFLIFPPQADPRDTCYVNYTIYSTTTESFAPTTLIKDLDPFGFGELPSKGYDSAWGPLGANEIIEGTVNHGALGVLRAIQIWGWYAEPDRSVLLQPVWEQLHPQTGAVVRDSGGQLQMDLLRDLEMTDISTAAPEWKIWQLSEAVLAGASPASVLASMTSETVSPLGTHDQWHDVLSHRTLFPYEAMQILAAEGIFPDQPGPNRLGPYDAILVYANHDLYMNSLDLIEGHDPVTGVVVPLPSDVQGAEMNIKVINLDPVSHFLQTFDYGPALHDDIATCRIAPSGGHSLEIFVDQPVHGVPKIAELQWRLGWSLRKSLGTIAQFDIFSQPADLAGLTSFQDEDGVQQDGWQYPAHDLGSPWRVDPSLEWLGPGAMPLEEGGQPGVVIGTRTQGFGSAKVPTGDLSANHPLHLVNHDSDGDGVPDALIFPDWMRNPDAAGADLIPTSKLWRDFQFINPANGTRFINSANPSQGLWVEQTNAFGFPIQPGANTSFSFRRPRSLGQAIWHRDGLFLGATGTPSRTSDTF